MRVLWLLNLYLLSINFQHESIAKDILPFLHGRFGIPCRILTALSLNCCKMLCFICTVVPPPPLSLYLSPLLSLSFSLSLSRASLSLFLAASFYLSPNFRSPSPCLLLLPIYFVAYRLWLDCDDKKLLIETANTSLTILAPCLIYTCHWTDKLCALRVRASVTLCLSASVSEFYLDQD